MRYLRFAVEGHPEGRYGVLLDDSTVCVLDGSPLAGGRRTQERTSFSSIERFLPPIQVPNIIALGKNYREHAKETDGDVPKAPLVFVKTTNTLTGHRGHIILPREAPDEVDYEVELGVIIKDTVKNVSEEKALSHVFGYTIGQDISARDCQLRYDQQWARGKCFDTFCPVGPWVETQLDPGNLMLRTVLNGKVMQEQSTRDMIFPVPCLVSYISRMMTLYPGTLIMTGTPGGVGFARKPLVFLKEGDVVVSEIEGIGRMENLVVREK